MLDAYYGPYRKETRYWTGFLLFLRFCLYLTFALNGLREVSINLSATLAVFSIVISVAWLNRRGLYEKLYLDLVEASFVLNLCLLTIATYHIRSTNQDDYYQNKVSYTFIGIAFVEFIGIVIFHIFRRIPKLRWLECLQESITNLCRDHVKNDENVPLKNDFVHTRDGHDSCDLQVSTSE